jgi:hypothetical protein
VNLFKLQRDLIFLALLLVSMSGCSVLWPDYALNNQIRLAVYQHERAARGKADDLVIHFNRTEPRVKFEGQNENGGRTVWLFDLAAKEYFDLLPAGRTFLYVHAPQYNTERTQAAVEVYRGDSGGYQGRSLTLTRSADDTWQVINDAAIAETP